MSTSIDQRIVRMQFDNAKFEKGVKQTVKSLDQLKDSLELDDASKSLERFGEAANSLSLQNVVDNLQTLTDRFSTMGIVGMNVISNLTNRFVNMASSMIKSMTIDQVTSGFDKYEQKMNSVRTIMNATGKSVSEVNGSLEELTRYTDETSYHYDELVGAISKFTSTGQDLDASIQAIEGIANAAALAGVGVNGASSAFLNFSQSMSKGAMKYDDWKSIEGLNMATTDLKQTFIDAAVAQGSLVKKTVKGVEKIYVKGKKTEVTLSNFGTTLSDGWLNTEVLMKGLKTMGDTNTEIGAKAYEAAKEARTWSDAIGAIKEAISSGWSRSFELMFGNVDQASQLWTGFCNKIIDAVAPISEARNDILEKWSIRGGRADVIDAFNNLWDIVVSVQDVLGQVAQKFDLGIDTTDLLNTSSSFKKFTKDLKDFFTVTNYGTGEIDALGEELTEERVGTGFKIIQNVANTAGAAIKIFTNILGSVWNGLTQLFSAASPLTGVFENITADISEGVQWFGQMIEQNNLFGSAIDALMAVLTPIVSWIPGALQSLWDSIKKFFVDLATNTDFNAIKEQIISFGNTVGTKISDAIQWLKDFWNGFKDSEEAKKVFDFLSKKVNQFKDTCKKAWKSVKDFFATIFGKKQNGKKKTGVQETIDNVKKSIKDFIQGPWQTLKTKFAQFKEMIKPFTDAVSSFGNNVANSFSEFLKDPLKWITDRYESLKKRLQPYIDEINKFKDNLTTNISNFLADPQKALDDLAANVQKFFADPMSFINKWIEDFKAWGKTIWDQILSTITSIFGGNEEKKQVDDATEEAQEKDSLFGKILNAVTKSWEWLKTGLGNVFNAIGTFFNENKGAIIGWGSFALVVLLLVKIVSTILGVIHDLATIKGAKNSQKTHQTLIQIGQGLLLIAAAIAVLVIAVAYLGNMKYEELTQGAIALGGIMVALLIFVGVLKALNAGSILKSLGILGAGVLAIALAMLVLIACMNRLKDMDAGTIVKGLIVMGIMLYALTKVMQSIAKSGNGGSWQAALEIIAVAIAIRLIVGALTPLAKLEWEQLAKIGVAMVVLTFCIKAMITAIGKANGLNTGNAKMFWPLIALAGLIWVLVTTLTPLAKLEWEELGKIGAALGVLTIAIVAMLGMVGVAGKFSGSGSGTSWAAILAVALLVWAVGATLQRIKKVKIEVILSLLGGISAMLLMAAACLAASKGMTIKSIVGFGVMAAALILIMRQAAESLMQVKDVNPVTIIAFLGGIAAALLIVGAVVGALSLIPAPALAAGMAIVAGIGILLTALLAVLIDLISSGLLEMGSSLELVSQMLQSFASSMDSISGDSIDAAKTKLETLFGVIRKTPVGEILDRFKEFSSMLSIAGFQLGTFFGCIAFSNVSDTALTNTISSLQQMAALMTGNLPTEEQIKLFKSYTRSLYFVGGYVRDFTNTITKDIDPAKLESANAILTKVSSSTDGIVALVPYADNGGLDKVKVFLGEIGGALKLYGEGLGAVGEDTSGKTTMALELVSALVTGLQNSNLMTTIEGMPEESNLTNFGLQLMALGGALCDYMTSVEGISAESIQPSIDALGLLSGLNDHLTETQSLVGYLGGDTSPLGSFADNIYDLGLALAGYGSSVESINSTQLYASICALQMLQGLNSRVTLTQGVINALGLGNPLEKFSENLSYLGGGLAAFATETESLDRDKLSTATNALKELSNLNRTIPGTGLSVVSIVHGEKNLGTFASRLNLLGGGLSGFAKKTESVDSAKVTASANALKVLADMNAALPNTGGIFSWLSGQKNLSTFAEQLPKLGEMLTEFSASCSGINPDDAQKARVAMIPINSLLTRMSRMGNFDFEHLGVGLTKRYGSDIWGNGGYTIGEAIGEFIADVSGLSLGSANSAIETIGYLLSTVKENTASNFHSYDFAQVNEAIQALASIDLSPLATAATKGGEAYYVNFKNAGEYLVKGFTNGIKSVNSILAATVAGISIAKAAYTAACKYLGIESPSKLFSEVGMYVDQGFANGLDSYSRVVEQSSAGVGEAAIDSAKGALTNFSAILMEDMDAQPTIRPVLDLTSIQEGAGQIGSMLNGQNGISIAGYNSAFMAERANETMQNNYGSDGTVKDILNTVATLGERLDVMAQQFSGLQLVLDTGVLAGQLTDKIDRNLGYKFMKAGRGQ